MLRFSDSESVSWDSPTGGRLPPSLPPDGRDRTGHGSFGLLGGETKGEVVLVSRLGAALERLNPVLPPEAIAAAIDEMTRERSVRLFEQTIPALPFY